jgi:hypothetical protein
MSRDLFASGFFSRIIFLHAPENNVRLISIFFENSRRYSQVQRAMPVSTTPAVNFAIGTAGVVDTGSKFSKMPLGAYIPNPKGGKIHAKKSYHSIVPLKGQSRDKVITIHTYLRYTIRISKKCR